MLLLFLQHVAQAFPLISNNRSNIARFPPCKSAVLCEDILFTQV